MALNVFAPIMVFYLVLNNKITLDLLAKPFLFMLILTTVLIFISLFASFVLKLRGDYKVSLILSVSMINVGNFGLPLIYFAYTAQAISYSMIYFVIFNIPLITVAIYLASDKKSPFAVLKDMLKMPIFYAFFVAIAFVEIGINLPESIMRGFALMNSGAIALLVFILGLQLSNIKIKFKFVWIIAAAVVLRLFISPLISIGITKILGISALERSVSIVQTSTPSALLPLMYMIKFRRDSDLLAAIIFFTTILAGLTLPVLIKTL